MRRSMLLCCFMLLALLCMVTAIPANAASGTCGEGLTWTLNDGMLTISGNGAIPDYSYSSHAPWYDGEITSIVIEDGVTRIGAWAFDHASAESISIATTVTSIGDYALRYNSSLQSIDIPSEVTEIGAYAFESCTALQTVTLSDSLTSMGPSALYNCSSLQSIVIPDGVTSLSSNLFNECTSLASVTLSNNVTTIWNNTFAYCNGLNHVFYKGLPSDWANVTVNEGNTKLLTALRHYVYNDNLSWTLQEGVLTISGAGAMPTFSSDAPWSGLDFTSVVIEDGITSISSRAFRGASGMQEISIAYSVTKIDAFAFQSCSALTEITLPDSITTVGANAFVGCTSLTQVTFGAGVSSFGDMLFNGCRALKNIFCSENNASYVSVEGVLFNQAQTALVLFPTGYSGGYRIPDGTVTIRGYAFYSVPELTELIIPEGVTRIEMMAIYGCNGLTELTLPASLRNLDSFSITGCTGLTEVTIHEGLTNIQSGAFTGSSNLSSVRLPKSITSIGGSAFDSSCQSLSTVYYAGTEEEWGAINIASSNTKLLNATVYLNSPLLDVPTNIRWIEGSLATAVWDAVDGAGHYQLEVYVYAYDESNPTNTDNMIGTYMAGTSDTSVDIQQEIHTIIGENKDNPVLTTYRVAAGFMNNETQNYIYSNYSIFASLIIYDPSTAVFLDIPAIEVSDEGLLTIYTVDHADGYYYRVSFWFDNQPDPLQPSSTETVEIVEGFIGADQAVDGVIQYQFDIASFNEIYSSYENPYNAMVYVAASSNDESYLQSDFNSCPINLKIIGTLESIRLSPEYPIIYQGKSLILGKTIVPDDYMYTTIDWISSDMSIVTVSTTGTITGIAPGTATISATIDGVSDIVSVTVYTISSNIEDEEDQQQAINAAGDIIDDIANSDDPDLSRTDIDEEDLETVKGEVIGTISDGGSVNVDQQVVQKPITSSLTWYDIIQRVYHVDDVDSFLNVTFDMYVTDKKGDDHHIGNITEFEEPMTVSTTAPSNEPQAGYTREYEVFRIHDDGGGEQIESLGAPTIENGNMTFESDKFSDFVIAYRDVRDPVDLSLYNVMYLPSGILTIGSEAFAGTAAQVIVIPEGCQTVSSDAFTGCENLVYIVNYSAIKITAPEGVELLTAQDIK